MSFHFIQIIRQQFPQITTRRLGTRGQSKYVTQLDPSIVKIGLQIEESCIDSPAHLTGKDNGTVVT